MKKYLIIVLLCMISSIAHSQELKKAYFAGGCFWCIEAPFDKVSFNNQRMELTWNDQPLRLEQEVEVVLTGIDSEKKKPIFEWKQAL